MLRDIIRKEIVATITSPKFIFTFLLCTVLILLSVYTGITNYVSDQKEHAAAVALDKIDLESKTSYRELSYSGIKVERSPRVLSIISNGVDASVGRVASVAVATDIKLIESKDEGNPMFSIFGALDLTVIVKIVLSLFAVLFTYDAICGEKERGTLKLILSNKVPRDKVILGKIIGGYVSLLIPLIIPLVLSALMMTVFPGIHLASGDWIRFLLMFLMFFLYLSVFFTLGLFVSSRTARSSTSFLALLFIWVVFVMIIPKAAIMTAAQIRPIPSIHEITSKKEAFRRQIVEEMRLKMDEWYKNNEFKPGDDEKAYDEKAYYEKYKKFYEEMEKDYIGRFDANNAVLERDYEIRRRAQQNLAISLSRVSPASALTFSTMSLARTGLDEHQQFLDSLRSYQAIFAVWAYPKANEPDRSNTPQPPKLDLSDMPIHSYAGESLAKSLVRTIPDIILMIVMIIVFFAGAYVSFLKYDVR